MSPEKMSKQNVPMSFGVFYPTGHVVLAFPDDADSKKVREALLTGGYAEDEILQYTGPELVSELEKTLENASILAQTELEHVEKHLELAKQSCGFLVVYAPSDVETARVMNVAGRFRAQLAHKYNRLTLEDLL